jgi:hypothetical protein
MPASWEIECPAVERIWDFTKVFGWEIGMFSECIGIMVSGVV